MADRSPMVRTFFLEESPTIGIDFSNFPEVLGGASLSAPAINLLSGTASGITFGTPAITSTIFDSIPIGQAVAVNVTLTTKGQYTFECHVTMSSNTKPRSVRGIIIVR